MATQLAPVHEPGGAAAAAAAAPAPPRPAGAPAARGPGAHLLALCRRYPFLFFFLLLALSNAFGSFFSIVYNKTLIVHRLMDEAQQKAFDGAAVPLYNAVAYPVCFGLMIYLVWPLRRCLRDLRAGREVSPPRLERCRLRLLNLPTWVVFLNGLGWAPGAVAFPLVVCQLGGGHAAAAIWLQFVLSFVVCTLLTVVQTFFPAEAYLIAVLYPDFFRDARPADVRGAWPIPFRSRLFLLWGAVTVMPLLALGTVALSFGADVFLTVGVAFLGLLSGVCICFVVGSQLLGWIHAHADAAEQVEEGNFDVRIAQKRPDEWGRLTDRFNDMAAGLARGRQERETLGQMVSPEVRDEILPLYPKLGGAVQEVTVLFVDIRGFTRRSAGEPPERVVALLGRFLAVAVAAVEDGGGWVNKFLGDGLMALFNLRRRGPDHADLAVAAARNLCARLQDLNRELAAQGQAPLCVGVGIHSGPAVVGCIGMTRPLAGGRLYVRKELTAIGETVNLAQRMEQLTKTCPGPILLSEDTRACLLRDAPLEDLGPKDVPGCPHPIRVYRVAIPDCSPPPAAG
jgi:adenylate cyclase